MLFVSSHFLSLVNAGHGQLRRPSLVIKLFFRLALFILIYSVIIYYNSLYIISLDTGIVIYAGLYQSSSIIYSFVLVLVLIVIIFLIVY
jgi:hypothetical protein